MYRKLLTAVGCSALLVISSSAIAEGNRYDLPRNYHSEVSAAKAYILTNHDRGNKSGDEFSNAVLIDVRTIDEYVDGHPPKSYNIPFPHIYHRKQKDNPLTPEVEGDGSYIPQDPVQFVNDVMAAFPDKTTPILTLCRTGVKLHPKLTQ